MHVVVDEARHHGAPPHVDAARGGARHLRDLLVGADRDDAIAFDGDRLRDRELVVNRDDLAVGENQIGGPAPGDVEGLLGAHDDTGADQRRDHRGCAKFPHGRSLCEGAPL